MKKITDKQRERLVIELSAALGEAWRKYRELFGVPPYGTDQQIMAMLELMPRKELFVRASSKPGGEAR